MLLGNMITNIGCDIVKIERLATKKDQIAKKIFSDKEYKQYQSYKGYRQLEFLAGRFAAKEAIYKAHNEFKVLSEIEILCVNGKPTCQLDGYKIHISIAHEDDYAMAYVICEKVEGD